MASKWGGFCFEISFKYLNFVLTRSTPKRILVHVGDVGVLRCHNYRIG